MWYVLTWRLDGADEDSLSILQADTPDDAKAQLRASLDVDEESGEDADGRELFVNHVVACDTEPREA